MKSSCYVSFFLIGSIFSTLRAMEVETRPIIRTLSILPLTNPLWQAVEKNDLQRTQELIPAFLPISLDCQYALYKAATTDEMQVSILKTIEDFWFAKIERDPAEGFQTFFFNYQQLISKNSFPQGVIEGRFMRMFSRLKERVQQIKSLVQIAKLAKLAEEMPHEADPETLKEISARSSARAIYELKADLDAELENIPLDIRGLVRRFYKELQNEPTIIFRGLL